MSIMAHKYMNVVSVKKNGFNNLKTNKIMEKISDKTFYAIMTFILSYFVLRIFLSFAFNI